MIKMPGLLGCLPHVKVCLEQGLTLDPIFSGSIAIPDLSEPLWALWWFGLFWKENSVVLTKFLMATRWMETTIAPTTINGHVRYMAT